MELIIGWNKSTTYNPHETFTYSVRLVHVKVVQPLLHGNKISSLDTFILTHQNTKRKFPVLGFCEGLDLKNDKNY